MRCKTLKKTVSERRQIRFLRVFTLFIVLCFFFALISVGFGDWEISDDWVISPSWEIEGYSPPSPPIPPYVPPHVTSYPNRYKTNDRVHLHGGVLLKPNTQHAYVLSFNGRFKNITLNNGVLTLSLQDHAYTITSTTNDNINITLSYWFYSYRTQFKPISESVSSLSFSLNVRNMGEPRSVTGVSSYSYDEGSTTLSLTCASGNLVTIYFQTESAHMVEWYFTNIPMFMGFFGMALSIIAPTLAVKSLKDGDGHGAMIWLLIVLPIGIGLLIGWLWG